MADKRCDNGHFIDESWDICPYCPQDQSEPEIPVVRPARLVTADAPRSAVGVSPSGPVAAAPASATGSAAAAAPSTPSIIAAPAVPPVVPRREGGQPPPMERTVAVGRLETGTTAKRYVVGWLVGLNSGVRGEAYPVRMGRNVIGRDRRSDIVVNDDQASSHHADLVFRPEERRFILMDHNSTNGTYVNEAEIEPRRDLGPKDMIRIGSHKFLFLPLCGDGFHWDDEGPLK